MVALSLTEMLRTPIRWISICKATLVSKEVSVLDLSMVGC